MLLSLLGVVRVGLGSTNTGVVSFVSAIIKHLLVATFTTSGGGGTVVVLLVSTVVALLVSTSVSTEVIVVVVVTPCGGKASNKSGNSVLHNFVVFVFIILI